MTKLLELFEEGFFPGPEETEELFFERVRTVKTVASDPTPLIEEKKLSIASLEALLPSFFLIKKKKKLPLWYGAMTYVCELSPEVRIPLLQMTERKTPFIKREEIIEHEKVHALRVMFDEPKYEEFLAYRKSNSKLRRLLSPIFQTPSETLLAALVLTPPLLLFYMPDISFGMWLYAPLYFFLSLGLIRLVFRHRRLKRCINALKKLSSQPENLLLCLTDGEIASFAKGKVSFQGSDFRVQCLRDLFVDM